MALAHVIGNKTEAAYRRGDLFAKRVQLMNAWDRYCTKPIGTVAQFAGREVLVIGGVGYAPKCPADRTASKEQGRWHI